MRISDWSSDVCSSDLLAIRTGTLADARLIRTRIASRQFLTCAAPGYLDRTAPLDAVQDLDRHEHIVGTSTTWKFKQGDRRSEDRRVGKESVSTCRSRWSPYH